MDGIYAQKELQGFCYTQLTDVQQEVNGLLYPDRSPKFEMSKIKKITEHKDWKDISLFLYIMSVIFWIYTFTCLKKLIELRVVGKAA